MLLEQLKNVEENRDLIIASFEKAKDLKVKRITYMSNIGFGSGINVYITIKNSSFSALDAFLGLWLKNALWEEEIEDFDYSRKSAERIYDELFLDNALGYDLSSVKPEEAFLIVQRSIRQALNDIMDQIVMADDPESILFLDEPGIYVNRKYTSKNPVIIKKNDRITDAVRLFSSDIMGEFEELFMESEQRYIYFFK